MSGILGGLAGSYKKVISSVSFTNGTLFSDATYYYVAYKTTGTFTNDFIVSNASLTADILLVAGGGSGGNYVNNLTQQGTGGGGGGGVLLLSNQNLLGSYSVTVGIGGNTTIAQLAGNSSFGALTQAVRGGAGAGENIAATTGGSGGGGSSTSITAAAGTTGQGNTGGAGRSAGGAQSRGGGGGGGAGTAGAAAGSGAGGNAGNGVSTYSTWGSVTGTGLNIAGTYWFGGGGGGGHASGTTGTGQGSGGSIYPNSGYGGYGATWGTLTGSMAGPWSGSSGVVIVRYTRSQVGG